MIEARPSGIMIPVPDLKATNSFSRISDSGDLLRISSRLIQIWYEMNRSTTEEKAMPTIKVASAAVWIDYSLEDEMGAITSIISSTLNLTLDRISVRPFQAEVRETFQEIMKQAEPVWIELGKMIVIALVVMAILLFLYSVLFKPSAPEVVESTPTYVGEEPLPKGMTVQEYVDQRVEERLAYMRREGDEAAEQEHIEAEERAHVEERIRKEQEEEEQRLRDIEAQKQEEEDAVLRQEAESQRRGETLEQIRQFAENEPDAAADLLRTWFAEDAATEREAESAPSTDTQSERA